MEKRIGMVSILVENRDRIQELNSILSQHNDLILARQGLPLRDQGIHLISLVVEGSNDRIGALCGQAGRIQGIRVKSLLTQFKGEPHEQSNKRSVPTE